MPILSPFMPNSFKSLHQYLSGNLLMLVLVLHVCFSSNTLAASPDEITGELDVIHKDNFDSTTHLENDYFLRDDNGLDWYQLEFDRVPPGHLRSGQRIKARGERRDRKFRVESLEEEAAVTGRGNNGRNGGNHSEVIEPSELAYAQVVDERRAVVILVDLTNAKTGSYTSPGQVAGAMFTDSRSVDGLYRAASLGKTSFPADTDGDGKPDVFGPYTINYSNSSCNYFEWAYAAEAEAQAAGVDLSRYRHRVLVLPHTSELPACGWGGVANVGCGTFCRAWVAMGGGMIYVHELGHNLGMGHAATDPDNDSRINSEYGDISDPMGASRPNWYVFNAPHTDQMGWYAGIPGAISTVISSGTFNVAAIGLDPLGVNGAPFMLKIAKPDTRDFYYLSYRQPIGHYNQLSSTYTQGINIHRFGGSIRGHTTHIRTLVNGETFTDSQNGIAFTQVTQGNGFATVQVSFGCTPAAPAMAISPVELALRSGRTANFTVTLANQDLTDCGETTFALDYTGSATGWLSPADLSLAAAQSGSSELSIDSQLAEGSYPFTVLASDAERQESESLASIQRSATLIIDNTAPTIPAALTGSVNNQGQVSLSWQPASDALSGVADYPVYRNDAIIGYAAGNSFTDVAAESGASYEYAVSARDKAGNASSLSASVFIAIDDSSTPNNPNAKGNKGGGRKK